MASMGSIASDRTLGESYSYKSNKKHHYEIIIQVLLVRVYLVHLIKIKKATVVLKCLADLLLVLSSVMNVLYTPSGKK